MHPYKLFLQCCLMLVFLAATSSVYATDLKGKNRDLVALRAHLSTVLKEPEKLTVAVTNGKRLTTFCSTCHGNDGISKNAWEPNLAGQDANYLLDQLINFASHTRKNLVMNDLSTKLSDADLVDIAAYYSSMKNTYTPAAIDQKQALKGKSIYQQSCSSCHGVDGKGQKGFATLSGQKSEYLVKSMSKFLGGSLRSNSAMEPIMHKLTEADIAALAAYMSSINLTKDGQP